MNKIQVTSVKEPKWVNEEHTLIDCLITTTIHKGVLPFTANPLDCEEHGRKIFEDCTKGLYGEIKPYKAKLIPKKRKTTNFKINEELFEFINIANEEMRKSSNRSIITLWASKLEYKLEELLKKNGISKVPNNLGSKLKKIKEKEILGNNDIQICWIIKDIRNIIAHNWKFSLETESTQSNKKTIEKLFKELYELEHSELYHFQKDLNFLVKHFYTSSCARQIMKIEKKLSNS